MSEQHPAPPPKPEPRWTTGSVLAVIAILLLVIFFLENIRQVDVWLIVFKAEISLALALVISAALGFVAGILLPRFRRKRE